MTAPKFLRKATDTPLPRSSVLAASGSGLPTEILERAAKRLGYAGLLYAVTFLVAHFGPLLVTEPSHLLQVPSLIAAISIALGLSVFFVSRYADIRPQVLLDFGLIFQVVAAFGISMAQFWGVYSTWSPDTLTEYVGIPWECAWILVFPILAPNTPGKVLLASLGAASTGFLTIVLSKAVGLTSPDAPLAFLFSYFLFTTYLCAGMAFIIARIIYTFGTRLKKAQEIGSYQLVDRLGEGGMGEVWVAKHRMLARPSAIKLIRPELLGSEEEKRKTVLRRFEREAKATAALRSKHTIDLYDFGATAGGSFYYVTELLDGLDLDSLVRRFGPLPPGRAVFLLRQVCHSLGEAHESGLIHRDIKPANIHVCRLGPDFDFVKVLDFGLVKSRGDLESGETKLTKEGATAGTPAFMSPEMAMGEGIDGRADIYALGCVAYWALTGQLVFQADTPLATVVQHVQAKPVPPSQRTEIEIPESLERVVMVCLEKDPADRPTTAVELDALLAACMTDGLWTQEQAAEWWSLHMPDSLGPRKDELHLEVSAQEILAVKQ